MIDRDTIGVVVVSVFTAATLYAVVDRVRRHRLGARMRNREIASMATADIERIKRTLGVELPQSLVEFLTSKRSGTPDRSSVSDDSSIIIDRTMEYRRGYCGLPPWPNVLVYVGDEEDACPYVLDTSTGRMWQTDHRNLSEDPLKVFESFAHFLLEKREDSTEEEA